MKKLFFIPAIAILAGCGPHYTIPNFDTGDVEKVISSGRSPEACIDNLKEDAQKLNVKVRLTDVHHEAASGPIAWLYTNTYTCTGKVVKSAAEERKAL
jgi:hypothetical protein